MEALDKAISICDAEWKNDRKLWEHYKKTRERGWCFK